MEKKLIKLVGNPYSVYDGQGDFSLPYVWFDPFVFSEDIKDDLKKIIESYERNGYEINEETAYYAWESFSISLNAHWISVKGYNQMEDSIRFLIAPDLYK